jgi:hypothetical protein
MNGLHKFFSSEIRMILLQLCLEMLVLSSALKSSPVSLDRGDGAYVNFR